MRLQIPYGKIAFLTIDVDDRQALSESYNLLDILDRLGVKATFFIVANIVEEDDRLIKELVDRGHEIGSHGYSHNRLDKMSPSNVEASIGKSISVLSKYYDVKSFRAPYMRLPRQALRVLKRYGIEVDSSIGGFNMRRQHPFIEDDILRLPVTYSTWILKLPWRLQSMIHHTPPRIVVFKIIPGKGGSIRYGSEDEPLSKLVINYLARGYRFEQASHAINMLPRITIA